MTSLITRFDLPDGTNAGALLVQPVNNQEYRTLLYGKQGEVLHDQCTFWRQIRRPDLQEAMSFEMGWLEALAEDASRCSRKGIDITEGRSLRRGGVHVSYGPEAHVWAAEHHEVVKTACKALGISLQGLDR